ncbi:MBL fold metallo-hydrolase [Halostagnicola kamekurae]|uniref:Glyoxylase, beta-lactamase superfamily II n=1 Tax=Halostagnicola kamekurae TaxID=619731 RepID=A0A1I6RVY3_9EURY|nr:MBL fold metallo-hydrolase [Halostagnicola kamekurae]SFS68842.1 Glyoxylase, beta-lactamase superfamily II [Halostagnicola kamekurae]
MDRIILGNDEFEGENNAYVLHEGDSLALVDTGIATTDVRDDLREGLAEYGYEFADVDDIVLTHFHPDHAGLAGEVQSESDATVYVHEADAPLVEGDEAATAALDERRREYLEAWGIPPAKREELLGVVESVTGLSETNPTVTPIEDGDTLEVGGHTLETVHAPGHALGLCWFEIAGRNQAFVGDVILPVYTPNVGGADVRVERPLETYLETLRALADRDYDRVWPGHRDPIEEPSERALTIVDHHRERTERVVTALEEHGPADPWTVSADLFGELEGIHIVHGPGEAFAHLDHLVHEGVASVEDGQYRLVDGDADLESVVAPSRTP